MDHLKTSILKGAAHGVWAWLVYGLIEFILAYVLPAFWKPELVVAQWQWRPIGLILGVYALAGALFGSAGGALLAWMEKGAGRPKYGIVASLSLSAAFAGNLMLAWPLARSEVIALAAASLLIAVHGLGLVSDTWHRRTAFAATPWAVSLVLVAGPWISREALRDRSAMMKLGMSLLAMCAVIAISAILQKLIPETGIPGRRKAVGAAAVLALLLYRIGTMGTLAVRAEPNVPPAGQGPNVVLITMDTVRADHLSVYGYPRDTTPQLQAFAREATVYDRAFAAGDFTLPAHASIFTGLYPSWHGAYPAHPEFAGGRPLAPGATTLAGLLAARGYWTGGLVANSAFLQASTGLAQGFSFWNTSTPAPLTDAERPFYLRDSARRVLNLAASTSEWDALFLRASDINSRVNTALKNRPARPFFLFVNYMDAHYPYVPPAPFRDRFARIAPTSKAVASYNELKSSVNAGRRRVETSEKDALVAQYDAGIAYADSQIGELLSRLRELGLYDNTLILITSDHGEAFGDHNTIGHTVTSVFQESSHIPLLVKYPGQRSGARSSALTSQVDLLPTVLEAVRAPLPAFLQGQSLRSPRSASDVVFSEARSIGDHEKDARLRGVRRSIVTDSAKLVTWSAGAPELYDLAADPDERVNRYRPDDPLAATLLARMNAWTATIPRQLPKPAKLDKSTIDRIRSLGYAQ